MAGVMTERPSRKRRPRLSVIVAIDPGDPEYTVKSIADACRVRTSVGVEVEVHSNLNGQHAAPSAGRRPGRGAQPAA